MFDRGNSGKEFQAVFDTHFEDFVNIPAFETYFQSFAIESFAVAYVASNVDIRKKVHLYLDRPRSLAVLATPALYVEGESAGFETPGLRFGQIGEKVADSGKKSHVGGRIRTRRTSDRALVD